MAEQALLEQIYQDLLLLIHERDTLRAELQYANSTIDELSAQNIELNRLCTEAQTRLLDRLPAPTKPKHPPTPTMPSTPFSRAPSTPTTSRPSTRQLTPSHPSPRFPGTPSLPSPTTPRHPICENYIPPTPPVPLLTPAENLWRTGRPQLALNALHPILSPNFSRTSRTVPSPLVRTHALLLRAAILLAWDQAAPALKDADEALAIARERGWFELMGKAQFFRGLGAVGEGRWRDARWCFGLSVGVRGYEGLVEWWVRVVGRKLEEDGRGRGRGRGDGSASGSGGGMGKGKWKDEGMGKGKGKGKGKARMVSAGDEEGNEGHRSLVESWGWV